MEKVHIFTIVTKSYLAYAKALAVKIAQFHSGTRFTIFVVDPDGMGNAASGTSAEIRSAADLFEDDTFRLMTGYYTADELCNACKPWAHAALLHDSSINTTIYLDSDILVTGSLVPLLDDLGEKAILLTPHVLDAQADHGCEGQYRALLQGGIYNGGCLVLSRSPEVDSFLTWWKNRLRYECLRDVPSLCVDQPWLNFIPAFYSSDSVAICRRPGVNVGHWNMHERALTYHGPGAFKADSDPVLFIHFSGWDWHEPEAPSKYALVDPGESKRAWECAGREFRDLLVEQEIERSSLLEYGYGRANDGSALSVEMRRKFLERIKNGEMLSESDLFSCPNAFKDHGNGVGAIFRVCKAIKRKVTNLCSGDGSS
jgi:hypothetical protein